MKLHSGLALAAISLPLLAVAQGSEHVPYEIYGAYTRLSNSFNGVPGSRQGLNGWEAAVAFPAWHGLRFKMDVSRYSGRNLGATQQALSILGGGQYERTWHRERFFAQALFGELGTNRYWGPNGLPGETASFSSVFGGGVETPVSRHLGIRVEGDFRNENLALIQAVSWTVPYRVPGLPPNFWSLSTGVVWMPKVVSATAFVSQTAGRQERSSDSELIFEGLSSFGHYRIYASTYWSYLHVGGVEYARHSWGSFIGARMDYVAEVLPVVILREPSETDVWGNPQSHAYETVAGLGVSPIGLRMLWRDGKAWKPYFEVKGGMLGFPKKVLSTNAAYENFSLQESFGMQVQLNERWGFRAGISDFHFSNAFVVPSNPGIDEMSYNAAFCYRLGVKRREE
jgi:hypothetical protein